MELRGVKGWVMSPGKMEWPRGTGTVWAEPRGLGLSDVWVLAAEGQGVGWTQRPSCCPRVPGVPAGWALPLRGSFTDGAPAQRRRGPSGQDEVAAICPSECASFH